MAEAMAWVARITNISLEMVVPGILGTLLDKRWNTSHWGPVGFFLGLVVAVYHLLAITRQTPTNKTRGKTPPSKQPPPGGQPASSPREPANSDLPAKGELPPED